jgi:hypothetical protein
MMNKYLMDNLRNKSKLCAAHSDWRRTLIGATHWGLSTDHNTEK